MIRQWVRFTLAGGGVALFYLLVTTGLHEVLHVPFQISLAIGYATALVAHFTLQRMFVWASADGFALPVHYQVARYLAVAGVQYAITAAATASLPHVLGIRVTYVYLATVALITATNFVIFRGRVFHPPRGVAA